MVVSDLNLQRVGQRRRVIAVENVLTVGAIILMDQALDPSLGGPAPAVGEHRRVRQEFAGSRARGSTRERRRVATLDVLLEIRAAATRSGTGICRWSGHLGRVILTDVRRTQYACGASPAIGVQGKSLADDSGW